MNGLLSPFLRQLRMQEVRPLVTGHVLDYGCSDGSLSRQLNCLSYTGADIDPVALERGRSAFPQHTFISIDELQYHSRRYDTIVSLAVLGLLPDQQSFMRLVARLLRPAGKIVLTTPHPSVNWLHKFGGMVGMTGNDFGYESRRSLPDRQGIAELAHRAGLEIACYRRFMFGANQLVVLVAG